MVFSTTALVTALAATTAFAAQNPDAVNGYFHINDFYAHHIPGSGSSYIAFEASVTGPDVKNRPVTYCSYYGGDTAASQLASTTGSCLDPSIYWTFSGVAPPGEAPGNYTFAIYNKEPPPSANTTRYDLAILGFPAADIKTYHSVPRRPKNRVAYVATPTQFSLQATTVKGAATKSPPPPPKK